MALLIIKVSEGFGLRAIAGWVETFRAERSGIVGGDKRFGFGRLPCRG